MDGPPGSAKKSLMHKPVDCCCCCCCCFETASWREDCCCCSCCPPYAGAADDDDVWLAELCPASITVVETLEQTAGGIFVDID